MLNQDNTPSRFGKTLCRAANAGCISRYAYGWSGLANNIVGEF
jgi:hypothetical protein